MIRKSWTLYDVLNAHEAIDLEQVGEQAAHELAKRKAKAKR